MATVAGPVVQIGPTNSLRIVTWTNLTTTNADGSPFEFVDFADRCIQITGTFGVGGTLNMQGSNDGVNWATLSDLNGNSMSYTAATLKQINEAPRYMRPFVSAGDGTTSLTVSLVARKVVSLL
jgi:hypothetical protein